MRSFSHKLKKSLFITGREILSKKETILELALHIVFLKTVHKTFLIRAGFSVSQ